MAARAVSGFGVLAAVVIGSLGACARITYRPSLPRRTEEGGVGVQIERADLRRLLLDVDVSGAGPGSGASIPAGAGPPKLEGAWVDTDASLADYCSGPLAARQIEGVGSSGPRASYRLHFDDPLRASFEEPSHLTVRVVDGAGSSRCLRLPLAGNEPSLRWTLEPWGPNRPFSGRAIGFWVPVGEGQNRYASGLDLTLLRLGRWVGPLRVGGSVGLGFTFLRRSPNTMTQIPIALFAEAFPITAGRFVLGLGASYTLRPSWFVNDDSRGFQLVHGPVGSVELGYLPFRPLGFLEGARAGTLGLVVSVGRWIPDGGATVMTASIAVD
jgi:hypothetical protein